MARKAAPPARSPTLFDAAAKRENQGGPPPPLAERMRPRTLEEVVGQRHLLDEGKLLTRAILEDRVPSMMLWGPPGCGKTTLARVVAERTRARFVPYSAVMGGVPELRILLGEARDRRELRGERTILFIDEIHRFNKAQQDALLPAVERGDVVLIGATTENPSFAINAALLSRSKTFHLDPVPAEGIATLLERALGDEERGLGSLHMSADECAVEALVHLADGDARRALTALDAAVAHARSLDPACATLTAEHVAASQEDRPLLYDKAGEEHYNIASAFIKSMRGSDPDAALYWLFRMLDAGEDPLFLSRRMLIFASEDVGNADPRAISVAAAADESLRRVGMPEGAYPLAHACLYLASAPKSDGVKSAMGRVRAAIAEHGTLPVPKKLRNAPTKLMKEDGYGADYKYAHDYEGHVVPGETYLPDALSGNRFYEPTTEGFERHILERLAKLRGG
jgi:putative ATPase